ncbi:hypothetical protein [Nitrospirillum iridis]|uniref:Uncharacterized protein n=1 Tax=Nitrospirillum iridis TaxID=765888 RepID=A0A7X0AZB1_9PROT|nr:hypothetical protein [Nitrospirillum iridis]
MTVRQFEGEKASPRNATLTVLQSALEAAGVIFIQENGEGPGVRLRKHPALDPFAGEGATGLEMAKRFAKETAEMKDGDLVASNPPYGEKTVMGRTIWGRPKKPKD